MASSNSNNRTSVEKIISHCLMHIFVYPIFVADTMLPEDVAEIMFLVVDARLPFIPPLDAQYLQRHYRGAHEVNKFFIVFFATKEELY
jgi:hypothetical protein